MKSWIKYAVLLLFILTACNQTEEDKIFKILPKVVFSKYRNLTYDYRELHYRNDSIYYFRISDNKLESIKYTSGISLGQPFYKTYYPTGELENIVYNVDSTSYGVMRYQSFFESGRLKAKVYTRRIDPLFADEPDTFKRTDSLVMYSKDGLETEIGNITYTDEDSYLKGKMYKGYYGEWSTYNANGTLIEWQMPLDGQGYGNPRKAYKSYYNNGQLKEYHIQGDMYAGGVSVETICYDSLGHKTEHTTYEHLMPDWGTSYNHTFSIATTKQYYPNGKIKAIEKVKSFGESDIYKCGKWLYYNERGNVIRAETYGSCYNFELEEENIIGYD